MIKETMYQHLFGSVLLFWFTFLVACKLMMCLAIHWIIHLIKQSNVLKIKSAKLREIKKQFFALKIIKYNILDIYYDNMKITQKN